MPLAAVITVSDRAFAGTRIDRGGPAAVAALREGGFTCADPVVVPDGDAAVEQALRAAVDSGARLIVTTGGTGVGPRDRTPEATARVLQAEVPGIAEELRRRGAVHKPTALLSRGLAGYCGDALVINLPGSLAAVGEGMPVILAVAAHAISQRDGGDH